jgi:hypothetical protein
MQTLAAILGVSGVAAWILLIRMHIRDRKHGRIAGLLSISRKNTGIGSRPAAVARSRICSGRERSSCRSQKKDVARFTKRWPN